MNLATRAALFNALLFPGWGEIYLKKYKKGLWIITAFTLGILSIVWSIIQATIDILKVAPFKKGTVTFSVVLQVAINAIKSINFSFLILILFLMFLLWILSIIDAYLLGKKEMAKSSIAADQQSVSPPV
jgi:hypothetical protein